MHRFVVGDYLLQTAKDRKLLNYFKEKDVTAQGAKLLNWLHAYLGGLAQT